MSKNSERLSFHCESYHIAPNHIFLCLFQYWNGTFNPNVKGLSIFLKPISLCKSWEIEDVLSSLRTFGKLPYILMRCVPTNFNFASAICIYRKLITFVHCRINFLVTLFSDWITLRFGKPLFPILQSHQKNRVVQWQWNRNCKT